MSDVSRNAKLFDNAVIKLYKKFDLIASKYIVLRIKKDKRIFNDWLEAKLLQPSFIIENWDGYYIGWAIAGKIRTEEQKKFYKHLALRLKKTLLKRCNNLIKIEITGIWALKYALNDGYQEIHNKSYEMKELARACVSLTKKEEKRDELSSELKLHEELAIYAGTYSKSEDALFDFIRFKAYDYKRINLINGVETTLENLTNYCLAIAELGYEVIGGKGISTAKAKAKNIARWVHENYMEKKRKRKTKTEEELKMTRKERALSNAKQKYEKAHKAIISLVTGMFANDYKKKNGDWNISKIAKDAKVDRKTVYKHLRDEGLIK